MLDFEAALMMLGDVEGWYSKTDLALLYRAMELIPEDPIIVELGCYAGRSTFFMAEILSDMGKGHLWTVDIWDQTTFRIPPALHCQQAKALFLNALGWRNLLDFITVIEQPSVEAGKEWAGPNIDLLHVDAGHLYSEVKADTESWIPHVKVNGYAIFHDYNNEYDCRAQQAVEDALEHRPDWMFLERNEFAEGELYGRAAIWKKTE